MRKRPVFWVAAVVAVVAALAAVALSAGMRFYTVMTPSMGTTAPVGTLVVTVPAATYHVGEIVTYERDGRSYTHRIIAANADGTFITKGDLNSSPDPLHVAQAQVVGHAVWLGPGLGWLWQGLPWLFLGFLVVFAISLLPQLENTWRWIVRISGWTLVFCLVAVWLRPWVSLTQLGWDPSDLGGVNMHVVNTGLFPLDVLGNRLVSGQDAIVHVTEQNARGYYTLTPTLGFYWWEQVGLFLICLIPFALSFLIKDERDLRPARALAEPEPDGEPPEGEVAAQGDVVDAETPPAEQPSEDTETAPQEDERVGTSEDTGAAKSRRRQLLVTSAVIVAILVSVSVIGLTATTAALTAKVTNSTNSAGTRTFYSCANAVTHSSGSPYLAWAMGTAGTSSAADLNGSTSSTRVGTFANSTVIGTANNGTATVGCNNDNPKASVVFNGTSQCLSTKATTSNPQTFSLEAWFWTGTKPNGKIIGFGSTQGGGDSSYDRHIYVDDAGKVLFGTYNGGFQVISSPSSYADSKWHNVIGTFSSSTGMRLYLDGALVDSDSSYNLAENTSGYWKAGCGNLGGSWPDAAGASSWGALNYFKGQIQYAAVYNTVLTATQVEEHYQAGLG